MHLIINKKKKVKRKKNQKRNLFDNRKTQSLQLKTPFIKIKLIIKKKKKRKKQKKKYRNLKCVKVKMA